MKLITTIAASLFAIASFAANPSFQDMTNVVLRLEDGAVQLRKASGVLSNYMPTADTGAAKGWLVGNIVSNAISGDTVTITSGFLLTNALYLPVGVKLVGYGPLVSFITNQIQRPLADPQNGTLQGPAIVLNHNTEVKDLQIVGLPATNDVQNTPAIGTIYFDFNCPAPTNFLVQNVIATNMLQGIYLRHTNSVWGKFINCQSDASLRGAFIHVPPNDLQPLEFIGCNFAARGPITNNSVSGRFSAVGFDQQGGTIVLKACTLEARNARLGNSGVTNSIALNVRCSTAAYVGSSVTALACKFISSDTNGAPTWDIGNGKSVANPSLVLVSGNSYDPTKVFGPITSVQLPVTGGPGVVGTTNVLVDQVDQLWTNTGPTAYTDPSPLYYVTNYGGGWTVWTLGTLAGTNTSGGLTNDSWVDLGTMPAGFQLRFATFGQTNSWLFDGTLAGNVGGVTNIPGSGLQASSVNSNRFDAETLALFGAGGSGIPTSAGRGTNTTFYSGNVKVADFAAQMLMINGIGILDWSGTNTAGVRTIGDHTVTSALKINGAARFDSTMTGNGGGLTNHNGGNFTGPTNYFANKATFNGTVNVPGTLQAGFMTFEPDAGTVSGLDMTVTSGATGGTVEGYGLQVDGTDQLQVCAQSDGAGGVTNRTITVPYGVQFIPQGNTNYSAYAVGTAYTVTTTAALADFGTTDPTITIGQTGTYELSGVGVLQYNGTTYAGAQTLTLKLRRTNNTATDISNGSVMVELPVLTTFTGGDSVTLPTVEYAATAGDIVQVFVSYSADPSVGTVTVTAPGTWIRAKRIY